MAENWQAGDLALAIGKPSKWDIAQGYRKGGIYTVEGRSDIFGTLVLKLKGLPGGWRASAFRRIPPHTPDAEDEETIRLLRGLSVEPVA